MSVVKGRVRFFHEYSSDEGDMRAADGTGLDNGRESSPELDILINDALGLPNPDQVQASGSPIRAKPASSLKIRLPTKRIFNPKPNNDPEIGVPAPKGGEREGVDDEEDELAEGGFHNTNIVTNQLTVQPPWQIQSPHIPRICTMWFKRMGWTRDQLHSALAWTSNSSVTVSPTSSKSPQTTKS